MGKEKVRIKEPVTNGVAKVPVVMQMEALECGAASLTMILAYYNKWIPLEQVRADCGVSRDGSNAKNILKAARSYGFTAKGYRFEPEDLKTNGIFPCIIHWEFNHFVVLNGFKGNKAYLNDPAKGSYSVSMEAFDEAFTGICLFFEPNENFEPGGKPKSMIGFAKKRLEGAGMGGANCGCVDSGCLPFADKRQAFGCRQHFLYVAGSENADGIFLAANGGRYSAAEKLQCYHCKKSCGHLCSACLKYDNDGFLSCGYDSLQPDSYSCRHIVHCDKSCCV